MAETTPELLIAIDALLERGARAHGTIRPVEGAEAGTPSIASDDWSVARRVQYDQPMVNRWKTDLLRFLRTHYHEDGPETPGGADPYTEMHDIIDRAGVLWRAVEPGMALLRRLRSEAAAP